MKRGVLGAVVLLALMAYSRFPAQAGPGVPLTNREGIVYAAPDGVPLRLDAYLPARGSLHPGVVVIHGGGWYSGNRSDVASIAVQLAANGFAAFAVDYRLAPAFSFPAAVSDVQAAVAWVREHAPDLGVDPRRIGAIGFSAGGHLAAMLAVAGHGSREFGSRIRAAASWSGPLGLPGAIAFAAPEGQSIVEWQIEQFVGCGGEPNCEDRIREASPTTYVDPTDAALFIASSTQETLPFEQAKDMARALAGQSVPVRLVAVPGSLHAEQFAGVHVSASGPTVLDASVRFLRTWLYRDRPGDVPPGSGSAGWVRALSVLGLALVAVAAALAVRRRHASRAAASPLQWEPYEVDPAGIARIDALSRSGATQAEIAQRLAAEGYRKWTYRRVTTR